jgi:predicted RNA-binding Zn ribbon-like protein
MPLDELVGLVNEWGTQPRRLGGRGDAPTDPELTTLADDLHSIFAAGTAAAENQVARDRAARVTDLLESTGVRPVLVTGDTGELVQAWLVDDPGQATRAAAALALREQLAAHPDRTGVCADRQCADVWVDVSPAGRRRFCCLTSQNRARAESFRQRAQHRADQRR